MADLDLFRREVGAWLDARAPASLVGTARSPFDGFWGGRRAAFPTDDHRRWFEVMLSRGWTAPSWPTAYDGGGLSLPEERALREEMNARKLPRPLVGLGLAMIGPILLLEGTEAQKREHVTKIVRGEIRWCQGYSEPGAGSDLAGLSTRAVRDGDHFVIDGQKVWTSYAEVSDWIFCLARTNPDVKKQAGITFLLFDMNTPGITTRPIQLISGASPFCETFFEGVRVPVAGVVGEIDDGWRVAKSLLRFERSMVGESLAGGGARPPELRDTTLAGLAKRYVDQGPDGRLVDPLLRDAIARCDMDREALKLTIQRSRDRVCAGGRPGTESSIFKVFGTEVNMRHWDLAMEILGADGLGTDALEGEDDAFTAEERAIARTWLRSRGNSIEGGTSEVQYNIIARRVLGLPKG